MAALSCPHSRRGYRLAAFRIYVGAGLEQELAKGIPVVYCRPLQTPEGEMKTVSDQSIFPLKPIDERGAGDMEYSMINSHAKE